jgi:hypothetical protein
MQVKNKTAVFQAAAVLCAGSAWATEKPVAKALTVTKAKIAAFNPFSVSKHPAKVLVIKPAPVKNTKDNDKKTLKPVTITVPVVTTPVVAPTVTVRPVYTPPPAPVPVVTITPTTVLTPTTVRPPYIPPPRSAFLPPAGGGLGP